MSIVRVQLTGPASRYLTLLQEYGHLTENGIHRVLMVCAEGKQSGVTFDLPAVKRAAATVLFQEGAEADAPVLHEDWRLLFS